ncbi:hypothetical protein TNCV_3597401 [Trichonephila clavipes]|nr:hypothetical protein TNCV_3597401 [Trichonephila clavipes]
MISYDIAPDDSADIVGLKVIVFKSQPSSMTLWLQCTCNSDLLRNRTPVVCELLCGMPCKACVEATCKVDMSSK